MKTRIAIIFFLFSLRSVFAQDKAAITFRETTYNFGSIREEDGSVEHKFLFKNTGKAPLVIYDVKASCGCTSSGWTRDTIPPGQTGHILVSYNPLNRPGPFEGKTLTVTSNAEPDVSMLTITGRVIPKPHSPEKDYPVKMGATRLKYKSFMMGKINTKEPTVKSFPVYNDSDAVLKFSNEVIKPAHLSLTFEPAQLNPKETGQIKVTYNTILKNDLGYVVDSVIITTTDKSQPQKKISVIAEIEEYFPPLTPKELAESPRATFEKVVYDMGSLTSGEIVQVQFSITNTGKKELGIRKVHSNSASASVKINKTNLKEGETDTIQVAFNTQGLKGRQQKLVYVFTNDPTAPVQVLTLKANVK